MKFSTSNFLAYPLAVIYSEFFPSARMFKKTELVEARAKAQNQKYLREKWSFKPKATKSKICKTLDPIRRCSSLGASKLATKETPDSSAWGLVEFFRWDRNGNELKNRSCLEYVPKIWRNFA